CTPDEVRDILFKVVEGIAKDPITKEEVERAQRQLLAQWERSFTNSTSIAITLSEWAGAGDWRLLFLHRDRIKAMTPEHVNQVARKYLIPSNRTTGIFRPTPAPQVVRADVPPAPDMQDLLKNYKGGKGIALGETFDPTPEKIEKRVQRPQLPGNLKAALLPKKTRGEVVLVSLHLRFGNEQSLLNHQEAAGFIGPLLT